ncbi:bifunctional adenosylcobinamide kinase/adenosylcobinamide-phosphate guanylyltransferase [Methylobacterium aerolatum]|uniref:Bifunctional adenosylcobalamin biosynthesis protein n=1 Tax=Methylobacterium aerolatum TaxID=418708 RepID=A0ABU0I745_9HYPH|nr:bifunctional adenosylcobinamide kinase/adenosylcobinamide-phosphate guanylyltransferase [Methylobacterium aerolatum]MDQ0449922.1 adenosylcobinamide kinase/adenosylcobinamide-phosphate guanylyltransferase [Methylobacterium aerolatum]GJD37356.1 Bifunctional adenosylcobalamin biosynthesis protein CobP [Methylobacterium aerolatum]
MVESPPRLILVLGGARSGKSAYAEGLVTARPGPWLYLATAEIWDDEMAERVAHHRERRSAEWITRDVPLALPEALAEARGPVLVDCLTLWLTNLILAEADVAGATDRLAAACAAAPGPVVLVSNEVGLGIVPDNALARRFRDEAGRLHQRMAALADRVVLTVAGLPLDVKPGHTR